MPLLVTIGCMVATAFASWKSEILVVRFVTKISLDGGLLFCFPKNAFVSIITASAMARIRTAIIEIIILVFVFMFFPQDLFSDIIIRGFSMPSKK
jgi:hypothetical protein